MTRKPKQTYTVRIAGLTKSVDLFHLLEEAVDAYMYDVLSTRLAVTVAMFAWHMADWVYAEHPQNYRSLPDFQKDLRAQCLSLSHMQDIVTAGKHGSTEWPPRVASTSPHGGAFSRGFSKEFDVSRLEVQLADGSVVDFDDEATKVRDFWRTYFVNVLHVNVRR